ncbi:MAG: SH3 domain-containing protein [Acidobacteria bacterium]|nr:SH3 domain-containing protein [Acidobacteriota bacterium]
MVKKIVIAVGALALLSAGLIFALHRPDPVGEEAIVAERNISVWSRLAQVREVVATLRYGEHVFVLDRKGGQARVRTGNGQLGWMDARHLMDPQLWRRISEQTDKTRSMLVQATGKTRVPTNLEVVARAVAEWAPSVEDSGGKESAGKKAAATEAAVPAKEPESPKKEDWLLVRGKVEDAGEISGWVLGRFLEPGLPEPLKDYAAGIHFTAWFELARVPENPIETADQPVTGMKPIFLGAGFTGSEGQPCDFTLVRVYTWNPFRHRYETAYLESNFCGHFPIRVTPASAASDEAIFEFSAAAKSGGDEQRKYGMKQNVVHRIRETKKAKAKN